MKRYDNTERLGVIETDKIVTKNIGWIFREQPIADVGLDAIIEQVVNNEPKGKFIAIQIKTGAGNFYRTDKSLTYYVSNIHYNYWSNLSIPIILIAHLPNENETYWQEICDENFKKNKRKWKIDIPLNQKFNEFSKNRLIKLLSKRGDYNFDIYNGKSDFENEFDFFEDISCIEEATASMYKMGIILNEQTTSTYAFNDKIKQYIEQNLSIDSPQVLASFKGFGKTLNLSSKRLENEIEIFSQLYSQGILAFENIINQLILNNVRLQDLDVDFKGIDTVPESIEYALDNCKKLRESASQLSSDYPVLKEAKKQYLEVMELIIFELETAKEITINLIEKLQ